MKIAHIKPYACSMIDIFEDFLDDKCVDIPNEEKEGEDTEAHIYGKDFDDLMTDISEILVGFCHRNDIPFEADSWTEEDDEEELDSLVCYADDVTGTVGAWLSMEFDDSVPLEAREHLLKAYQLCVEQ